MNEEQQQQHNQLKYKAEKTLFVRYTEKIITDSNDYNQVERIIIRILSTLFCFPSFLFGLENDIDFFGLLSECDSREKAEKLIFRA